MKNELVELMKINNILNEEYEKFFLEHIDEFINNNERWVVVMQQSRATGDVKGRRPDFTTYFEDIDEWSANNNQIVYYSNESLVNSLWDYICSHEENKTYLFGDEIWTEIDICPGGFLFFNKIGIKLMLVSEEAFMIISDNTHKKQQIWFNNNYKNL